MRHIKIISIRHKNIFKSKEKVKKDLNWKIHVHCFHFRIRISINHIDIIKGTHIHTHTHLPCRIYTFFDNFEWSMPNVFFCLYQKKILLFKYMKICPFHRSSLSTHSLVFNLRNINLFIRGEERKNCMCGMDTMDTHRMIIIWRRISMCPHSHCCCKILISISI